VWNTALLGSGGANLTGGLSVLRTKYWVFAGRSDGHIVWFYYQ
jgi:hypothetical protein